MHKIISGPLSFGMARAQREKLFSDRLAAGVSTVRNPGVTVSSKAKTKTGRINLIRRVYAKMVREGQIIPPIGDA